MRGHGAKKGKTIRSGGGGEGLDDTSWIAVAKRPSSVAKKLATVISQIGKIRNGDPSMYRRETLVLFRALVCLSFDTETWGEAENPFRHRVAFALAPSGSRAPGSPSPPHPLLLFLELS